MAESLAVIGIVANIAQLVEIGCRVSKRIKEFQSVTKDVPVAFKEISIQLPLIIETCERVSKENCPVDTASFFEVIKGCSEHVEALDKLITKVLPSDQDSSVTRTWKAIGSIRLEKKAIEAQRILETYKTALILHIGQRQSVIVQPATQPSMEALSLRDTCYKYPSSLISQFIGREDILKLLEDTLLKTGSKTQQPNVAVLLGMGGQGKTALALEYCRRAQVNGYFKSILWIDAASTTTVNHSFENLADYLTKRKRTFEDMQACVDFVKDTIETWAAPWMVVFDNFDQPDKIPNIMNYVPNASDGAVLVTTRHAESAGLGTVFEIDSMKEDESIDLLLHRTSNCPSYQNVDGARSVVQLLGYLPLAIDQAGAYIRARKISFSAFLDHFQNRREKVLQHTPTLWDYRKKLGEEQHETSLSVFTTWELSFDQIAGNAEQKIMVGHFMTLLGFFGNIDIPQSMFRAYFESSRTAPTWMEIFESGTQWDTYSYEDAVTELSQLSLLQHARPEDTADCRILLHPLIRDWTQFRLLPEDRKTFTVEAMSVLESYINQSDSEDGSWPLQVAREVLTHIDTCIDNYDQFCPPRDESVSEELRDSLLAFGLFYNRHGHYKQSEDLLSWVLLKDEMDFGPEHIKTIETKLHLAEVVLSLGRYREAEVTLEEALLKSKNLPDATKAGIYHHHGKARSKQGRYPEAIKSFILALQLQKAHDPPGHIDLLNTYVSLAQVYRNQGHNDEAISLYSKALEDYAKYHSEDHPGTFHLMVSVANCYRNLSRLEEAEEIYKKALCGNEKYFGAEHPATLNNMVNLAINYHYLGQEMEAEELLFKALTTSETKLGPEHPETLRANMNLASMYLAQGCYEEARVRLRLVLDGRLKKLGIQNHYTQHTLERLVSTLWLEGRASEANDLADQMLRMEEESAHSKNVCSNAEELILRHDYQFTAIEIIFTRALVRRHASLVGVHSDTVETTKSLARIYAAQDRPLMVENLLRQLIAAYEEHFGPDHKATRQSKQDLSDFRKNGIV